MLQGNLLASVIVVAFSSSLLCVLFHNEERSIGKIPLLYLHRVSKMIVLVYVMPLDFFLRSTHFFFSSTHRNMGNKLKCDASNIAASSERFIESLSYLIRQYHRSHECCTQYPSLLLPFSFFSFPLPFGLILSLEYGC